MDVAPPLEQTTRFRHFTCPECHGALEPMREPATGIVSYLCRIGHRYSPRELLVGMEIHIEQTLWSSLTAVDELIVLMTELEERSDPATDARDYRARTACAIRLRALIEQVIAQNEPVRLDGDLPLERDPNSRLRQEG